MAKESPLIANKKSKTAAPAVVYKPPSTHDRMKRSANDARVAASADWVAGRISTKQHDAIHARAAKVLTGKPPMPAGPRGW